MIERAIQALQLDDFGLLPLIDILIMAFLIYRLLLIIRGRRAANVLIGVFVVVAAHFVSRPEMLNLRGLHTVLGYVLFWLPVAVIVLFQNPIRQALARVARNPLELMMPRRSHERVAQEVALAASSLASKGIGALIVLERKLGMRTFYDTGIMLDARVTYDLLMNLFTPGAPLHDGAAIIAEGRIKAASCYLPLTTNPSLSRTYGTRHRAAIGATEEYDAVAIVVSEERGIVSICEDGRIFEDLDASGLASRLASALAPKPDDESDKDRTRAAAVTDSSHA